MSTLAEKIAHTQGKTSYRDPRDGFAIGTLLGDPDTAVKFALGAAKRETGELSVQVLETYYAGTLMHEESIRRAYDRQRETINRHATAKRRMGCALAIRVYAGLPWSDRLLRQHAWMVCAGGEAVQQEIDACTRWLDDLRAPAERAFLAAYGVD